jgi:mutator protein MutT
VSQDSSSVPQRIAIAVVEHEGCFLIGPRPATAPLGGLWEFPGGKVRAGESAAQAAVRECREETGLGVEVQGFFPEQLQSYAYGTVRLQFLHCRPLGRASSPHAPFRWVPRAELRNYPFPAGNRALLALLVGNPLAVPARSDRINGHAGQPPCVSPPP